jgi:hypothetical protein
MNRVPVLRIPGDNDRMPLSIARHAGDQCSIGFQPVSGPDHPMQTHFGGVVCGPKGIAVWTFDPAPRRGMKAQPLVSTLGTGPPQRRALKGRQIKHDNNIHKECVKKYKLQSFNALSVHISLLRKRIHSFPIPKGPRS